MADLRELRRQKEELERERDELRRQRDELKRQVEELKRLIGIEEKPKFDLEKLLIIFGLIVGLAYIIRRR